MPPMHGRTRPSWPAPSATAAMVIATMFAAGLGGGILLGWLFSSPTKPTQVTAQSTARPSSADPAQDSAAADTVGSCEQQTWPYIDEKCRARLTDKSAASREVRVIPTDRTAPP